MTIVIPVFNGAATLGECLAALLPGMAEDDELVVVDDGSSDDSAAIAATAGVRVVRQAANGGQAAARNAGVRYTRSGGGQPRNAGVHDDASGDVLLFVDADVVVAPDVVGRVRHTFVARPEIAALFGSYDDRPRAGGIVSAYRNLLHHYVHQRGAAEAFTFWAGCGAVRRAAFEQVGGFDERPWRRAIEDIELGYRLRAAGYRILLDPTLLSTHLKRWTLRSMVWTDTTARALPWTRLMIETPGAGRDLNLTLAQRASVALVGMGLAACGLALVWSRLLWVGLGALVTVAILNRDLYLYFARRRGAAFALASIPLHILYFVCSGVGFAWAWAGYLFGRRAPGID